MVEFQGYFGSHSARYNCAFWKDSLLYYSLGNQVIVRNQQREIKRVHCGDGIIVALIPMQSGDIITINFDGKICLLDQHDQIISQFQIDYPGVRHASLDNDEILLAVSSTQNQYSGIIYLLSIEEKQFQLVKSYLGNFTFPEFTENNQLGMIRENVLSTPQKLRQRDTKIKNLFQNFEVDLQQETIQERTERNSRKNQMEFEYYYCIPEQKTYVLLSNKTYPLVTQTKGCKTVILFYDREIQILDNINASILKVFQIPGSGAIRALDFDGEYVWISPSQSILYQISSNLDQVQQFTNLSEISQSCSCIRVKDQMLASFSDGVTIYNLSQPQSIVFHEQYYSLTCCGCNIKDEQIAVGDFNGKVIIISTTGQALSHIETGLSVRSLLWFSNNGLIIGTMSGHIFYTNDVYTHYPEELTQLKGSISCMSIKHNRLAVGTTRGVLSIFRYISGYFRREIEFVAHMPDRTNSDKKFGSLKYYSEIWTLDWNPTNSFQIITGSEDQRCVIWNVDRKAQLEELEKHGLAVTGVLWWETNQGVRIATGSDDRRIKLYNDQRQKIMEFNTDFIIDWHTITYMKSNRDKLCCVTQNGYIVVISLDSLQIIYSSKIHNGSIEGLSIDGEWLATCSSECIVSIAKL